MTAIFFFRRREYIREKTLKGVSVKREASERNSQVEKKKRKYLRRIFEKGDQLLAISTINTTLQGAIPKLQAGSNFFFNLDRPLIFLGMNTFSRRRENIKKTEKGGEFSPFFFHGVLFFCRHKYRYSSMYNVNSTGLTCPANAGWCFFGYRDSTWLASSLIRYYVFYR